jgi:hypothetical protein
MPAWDNQPRLDRQVALQGVLFGGVTGWSLPYTCRTVDFVVLAHSAFGDDHGKVVPVGNCGGTDIYTAGDYTAGCVIAGESYNMKVVLGRLFLRDPGGTAVTRGNLLVREVRVNHRNTGYYKIQSASGNSSINNAVTAFESDTNDVEEDGHSDHWIGLQNNDLTLQIESDRPNPVTISTVSVEVDHTDKAL